MPIMLESARQIILPKLKDPTCPGLSLVMPGDNKQRIRLAAWAIDECARTPTVGDDEFRALYASGRNDLLKMLGISLQAQRFQTRRRQLSGINCVTESGELRHLKEVNYARLSLLRSAITQFPKSSIELLIVDVRRPHEAEGLEPLLERAQPLFTLVISKRLPLPSWSGAYLGAPICLRDTEAFA